MNQSQTNYLTNNSGDPFADTGGYVIQFFQKQVKWKDKPILDLLEYMAGVYVNQWGAGINALFLNSQVTQASFKGEQKIAETVKYFRSLFDSTAPFEMGYCRITGQFTQLFKGGRENYMMSGSGAFINFHHSFDEGIRLSKEVLVRLFFVPFGVRQIGGMVGVISSNHELITQKYVEENCQKNIAELGSGMGAGVLKHDIGNPTNALFEFAASWIRQIPALCKQDDNEFPIPKEQTTINLIHFTNFAAAPDIQLLTLPADVFEFYTFCQGIKVRKQWNQFVRAHHRNTKYAKAKFSLETENWETGKESLGYDDYKNWRNQVFDNLLQGKSLTRLFANWTQHHRLDFIIISKYLTTIRNMDKRTVEKILFLADFVVGHDPDFISKTVRYLDGCRNAFSLRRAISKWNADNAKAGNEPLVRVEEYVNYLFSDSSNWSEIRDVLIIAIYEKSYDKKIRLEVELTEDETINSELENS
ncbi:MAG: type I-B CRISPR-associated protein Cas8b1/Cst1 [Lewinellaceae bacterium]|nr:type I-B CRISPR-associated protein Cas8b1/Cst1 [Lewinellaceae bacterium]